MEDECCCGGFCYNCKRGGKAIGLVVFGAVLIFSRIYYPSWDIWVVVGALAILGGLVKAVFRCCPHCKEPMKPTKGKK